MSELNLLKKYLSEDEIEALKEIKTSSIDIRDTNYTQLLIEINNTIRENKEFINDFWIGIYYNRDIANVEYLAKED